MQEFNSEEFIKLYNENMSLDKTRLIFGYSRKFVNKMIKEGKIEKIPLKGRHISEEHKMKTSVGVKKFLKENRNNNRFYNVGQKSVPCEHLKSELKNHGFDFVEEYRCFEDRNFIIDIAFPLKKICFEVNGSFHYDNTGKLKPYYQERHDFIVSKGWNIIEIPHMMVYNKEYIEHLISILNENECSEDKYEDLKQELIKKEKEKHICSVCGGRKKNTQSKMCLKCSKLHNHAIRKNMMWNVNVNELINIISGKNMTQIAKEFKTGRSKIVKILREKLPNYKNYIKIENEVKDLSFLSNEQMISEITSMSLKEFAEKYETTRNHAMNEFKKRNIDVKNIKKTPIPNEFSFEGISIHELSRKYGVDRYTIRRWIKEQKER